MYTLRALLPQCPTLCTSRDWLVCLNFIHQAYFCAAQISLGVNEGSSVWSVFHFGLQPDSPWVSVLLKVKKENKKIAVQSCAMWYLWPAHINIAVGCCLSATGPYHRHSQSEFCSVQWCLNCLLKGSWSMCLTLKEVCAIFFHILPSFSFLLYTAFFVKFVPYFINVAVKFTGAIFLNWKFLLYI